MSTETYKTIDKLVRKWSYLFNLDDHHAGKLRKSLENRAECLERKYDPNQCGNYEGYIASCLAKFAGCDASRAKDQQSARGEVPLDEPVNGEDADAATRLDFIANDERVVAAKRRAKDVWETVALLPPAYRRVCEKGEDNEHRLQAREKRHVSDRRQGTVSRHGSPGRFARL